jgi:hypothetical protein
MNDFVMLYTVTHTALLDTVLLQRYPLLIAIYKKPRLMMVFLYNQTLYR